MKVLKTIKFSDKKKASKSSPKPSPKPYKPDAVKKIDELVNAHTDVLYRISNIFPFDFFPDTIIVTRKRVDIVYGLFIASKEVISIEIENIFDISLDFDLFFATMDFNMRLGQEDPTPVKFLSKIEAIKMRRIITGLVAAKKENIDIDSIPTDQLVSKLTEIGEAREK